MRLNNSSDHSEESPNSQYWINCMNGMASDMSESQRPEDSYYDDSDINTLLANAKSGIITAKQAYTELSLLRSTSDSIYLRSNPDARMNRDELIASVRQTYQEGLLDLGMPVISKLDGAEGLLNIDSGTKDQVAKLLDKFRS